MSRRCRPLVPLPTEDAEQRALAVWLNVKGLLWVHVPNGGHRAMSEARRFKQLGVKAGVPDILIFDPPSYCSSACAEARGCERCARMPDWGEGCPEPPVGTAIELKRKKGGRVTEEQADWLVALRNRRWAAQVCHGAQEAIDWLLILGY